MAYVKTITSQEILTPGTKVKVGNKIGTVLSHEVCQAIPRGLITVHTIKFTHKLERHIGKYKIVELAKPKIEAPNYSFVELWNN